MSSWTCIERDEANGSCFKQLLSTNTGLILNLENLENLENRPFFIKSQGRRGIVNRFCIIFIKVREKSGNNNYLDHISF